MDLKKTKIVATISDLNCSVEFITSLYKAGMNVARLNTAHQSEEDTLRIINNIRKVSESIGILVDTKGPEIRTFGVQTPIEVKTGDQIKIYDKAESISDPKNSIATSYPNFIKEIPIHSKVLVDDGETEFEVIEIQSNYIICKAQNDGIIKNKKSINVPNVAFDLPALSEKDRGYIQFAIKHDIDFIAHSFVRKKEDVIEIQEMLDKHKCSVKIIAKIEDQQGVNNIDEILEHVYGVMVARGDLAIEIPYEKIPGVQKMIVNKCINKRKPVIIATQMLHSMINNPRPTRAEVSDIANAIYSKTDAIMLSGETAYGKYPLEAVTTMAKVALEVEKSRSDIHETPIVILSTDISAFLSKSAVKAALELNCKAIVADTSAGHTIRNAAAFRGKTVIYAHCYSKRVVRELALSFGVYAHHYQEDKSQGFIATSLNYLLESKQLTKECRVVVLGGNYGKYEGASFIEISTVDNLLKEFS
jgi:pyruvate kinase